MTEQNGPDNFTVGSDNLTVSRELLRQAFDALREIAWSNDSKWQSDRAQMMTEPLRAALEQPVQSPAARYIGESCDGSLVQLFDDLKKGTDLYTAPQPVQPINQCDGCRSGQEMRGPLHIDRDGKPTMVCQASKYRNHDAISRAVKVCQDWIDDHASADNCTYNDCDMVAAVTDVMNKIKELE